MSNDIARITPGPKNLLLDKQRVREVQWEKNIGRKKLNTQILDVVRVPVEQYIDARCVHSECMESSYNKPE